jgi:hypothetical protein
MLRRLACIALIFAIMRTAVYANENTPGAVVARHIFYVATDGNDEWSGRLANVNENRDDGPFATLTRARDAIRQLKFRNDRQLDRPVDVLVRGGTYHFREPLRLSGGDSGTESYPITYAAYPKETPVLTGGMVIEGWQPYQGQIVKAHVPHVRAGWLSFRQLFYNGRRMIRARWPQFDDKDPLYGGWAFIEKVATTGDEPPQVFQFEEGTFPHRWANPHRSEIFVIPGRCWLSDSIPVRSVDWQKREIELTRPVGPSRMTLGRATHLQAGNRFYVENNLEDLTGPGQWCLDVETGMVYLWPPDNDLASAEVTAPAVERIVQMIGQVDAPVTHITFRGLTFTQTQVGWPTAESYYKTPNAGQTFYVENGEDCSIQDNHFVAVGGDAIRLQNRNARISITGNHIEQAGAYGILVGGIQRSYARHDTFSGDLPSPPEWHRDLFDRDTAVKAWPESREHLISNNHIHHVGVYEKHGAGISLFGVKGIDVTVSHNVIHHTPRFGIALLSGLGSVTVEYNDLQYISLETADTGALTANRWYTYDKDPELSRGNIVRYNRIRDCVGCGAYARRLEEGGGGLYGDRIWVPYYGWGIYFDNAPMDVIVEGNICARNTLGGIMISHYGKNVTVRNNIFVNSDKSQAYLLFRGQMSNIQFSRNIFAYSKPDALYVQFNTENELDLTTVLTECNRNIIFHAGGNRPELEDMPQASVAKAGGEDASLTSWQLWQRLGYDTNSVLADPKFVDPENDDYTLQADSPALKLGFEPIDTSRIGLLRDQTSE